MVTVEFQDDRLVVITFTGSVRAVDIEQAWASFADPRYSGEHDVIVDASLATIDFPVDAVTGIIDRRDAPLKGAYGITCFIAGSHLKQAAIHMVRDILGREARWHFVRDFDEARARIADRRAAD